MSSLAAFTQNYAFKVLISISLNPVSSSGFSILVSIDQHCHSYLVLYRAGNHAADGRNQSFSFFPKSSLD